MVNFLDPRVWLVALLLCIGSTSIGYLKGRADGAGKIRLQLQQAKEQADEAQLRAVEVARTEEQRRTQAQTEIANAATQQATQSAADADAAHAAAERLRQRVAELVRAAARPADPTATSSSPHKPSGDPLDVLVGVLQRADDAAGILGNYADRLKIAGAACERAYDALTSPAQHP